MNDRVKFGITSLRAHVAESISIEWQGHQFDAGLLKIEIDDSVGTHNLGALDYAACQAEAEFHVLLTFPQLADTLEELGADPERTLVINRAGKEIRIPVRRGKLGIALQVQPKSTH